MIKLNKKGVDTGLTQVFLIVLIVIVLGYFLNYSREVSSNLVFEKQFLAVNLATVLEAVQAVDGNVDVLVVPQKVKDRFSYAVTKNKVEVFEKEEDVKKGVYYFALRKDLDFQTI